MIFDREYINKTELLSEEVLQNDKNLSPTARLLIETLVKTATILFDELEVTNARLKGAEEEIKKLKLQLAKNSRNSNLSPSSDRPNHNKKKEPISKLNKPGAQVGHIGHTLQKSETPDKVVVHKLKGRCNKCGISLRELTPNGFNERQVFDLIIKKIITSHQAETAKCNCGKMHVAEFPEGIVNHTQYGNIAKSFINYFSLYQLIPYERLTEVFRDLFKMPLCEGTVFNTNNKCSTGLQEFENNLKQNIIKIKVNHSDESPIKIKVKNAYLHVFSNEHMTYLHASKSRGQIALDEMNLLNKYKHVLVHDSFAMYFSSKYKNSLCHSHLGREFTFLEEELKVRWAHKMRIFFLDLNDLLDDYRSNNIKQLPNNLILVFENEYDKLIEEAKIESPLWNWKSQEKKPPDSNLLRRLIIYKEAVLRFMKDLDVPFTNNLAERDLRMAKVRQKISGCFRTLENARSYARIRSFISTLKKQNRSILQNLALVHSRPNYGFSELFS
jgi:hypothetical protein